MYEITHGEYVLHLNTMAEVIQNITDLHNDCKQHQPQMVAIKLKDTKIEIGVGDKQNRTVVLFYAKNVQEDSFVSFNEGYCESIVVFHRKKNIPFEARQYNLIPIHIALTALGDMLANSCLSKNMRWGSL